MPYVPYYNYRVEMDSHYPQIFNRYGEPMKIFFFCDHHTANTPYWGTDRYIFWDRYNYGLKTHFYSNDEIFTPVGNPDRKFAILLESRAILPESYRRCIVEKEWVEHEYQAIFTYDYDVLNHLSNAKFVPFCANLWYGKYKKGVKMSPDNYRNKTRQISILASFKQMCDLHIIRKCIAKLCKAFGWADTYGTFDGGEWVPPEESLQFYRYSIVIENDISPYFFTEKLTNCFAAQTIPIYLGATHIDRFFNKDGIIPLTYDDIDHVETVLAQCTTEEYERRLPAVLDNYQRVQKYHNPVDFMYEEYLAPYFDKP